MGSIMELQYLFGEAADSHCATRVELASSSAGWRLSDAGSVARMYSLNYADDSHCAILRSDKHWPVAPARDVGMGEQ